MMVGESPRHAARRHDGTIDRTTTSRLPTSLPRAGSRTRRSRLHRRRQHHPAQHPLRHPELPLSRRPPPQLHGPYWQWTAKVNGKTVTRRLSETDAKLYHEWISNDRKLRKTITRMRQVAAKASELMITKANKAKV